NTRCTSVGELEITLRISAVAACCSRASESSLVSSWILRSAEARSSVGEAAMTTRASHTICPPYGFGLPGWAWVGCYAIRRLGGMSLSDRSEARHQAGLQGALPIPDSCSAAKFPALFDHFISTTEQRGRHGEIEYFRRFEVDHQFVLGRRLDRKFGWLLAFENPVQISCSPSIWIDPVGTVGH